MKKTTEQKAKEAVLKKAKELPNVGEVGTTASGIVAPKAATEQILNDQQPTYDGAKDAVKGDAIVEWKEFGKFHTRLYSEETHGENFEKLAEQFAEKKNGKVYKK